MYQLEKSGGGVPAKRICSIDGFLKKYQDKFNTSPHLDLNGKRTFELDDSVTDKFIATLVDNIGFIE